MPGFPDTCPWNAPAAAQTQATGHSYLWEACFLSSLREPCTIRCSYCSKHCWIHLRVGPRRRASRGLEDRCTCCCAQASAFSVSSEPLVTSWHSRTILKVPVPLQRPCVTEGIAA